MADHGSESATTSASDGPNPARVVADADVLAADLLVGGDARDALDHVRRHSWVELVATDELLADAEAVVAELTPDDCAGGEFSGGELAAGWRERVEDLRVRVEQEPGDHPAVASAYHGDAAHLLSFDEDLRTAKAGVRLRKRVDTSVKHPRAFARLFDPERLYLVVRDGEYPGPDRDPRN